MFSKWLERVSRRAASPPRTWIEQVTARLGAGTLSAETLAQLSAWGIEAKTTPLTLYLQEALRLTASESWGHYEFWDQDRLCSRKDDPTRYGGTATQWIIADWLLDSLFVVVDTESGLVSLLGGPEPLESHLELEPFLRGVLLDPEGIPGVTEARTADSDEFARVARRDRSAPPSSDV